MRYKIPIDLVALKAGLKSGKLATKINTLFDTILIEDTESGEAVEIMQIPEGYSFHKKGKWSPIWEYTSISIDRPMEGREAWSCSECGWTTDERHDWCVCGADMRESNKISSMTKKAVEELLENL